MNSKSYLASVESQRIGVAVLAIAIFSLPNSASANIPDSAKVSQIVGPNSLGIRRHKGSGYDPVNVGSAIRYLDKLDVPSTGKTFARLDFYNSAKKFMGLAVQATIKNQARTSYYFPCEAVSRNNFIIEWTNQKTGRRGCEKGLKVRGSTAKDPLLRSDISELIASNGAIYIGQNNPNRSYYCTVLSDSGKGWIGIASSEPCEQPLKECKDNKAPGCAIATLDYWDTKKTQLTALVSCDKKQEFNAVGDGKTFKDAISKVWLESATKGATNCGLQVISPDEMIVTPASATDNARVEINSPDSCFQVKLYRGSAIAKTTRRPEGLTIESGDDYRYCQNESIDSTSKFDPQQESVEMQVFLASSRGYKLCDEQQPSGGQEGDTRTIQMTANSGVIKLDYEMFGVPDRLRVIYEGKELINTGFVSGSNKLSIPFSGKSGQVTVEVTGNVEDSGTQWNYNLRCPVSGF